MLLASFLHWLICRRWKCANGKWNALKWEQTVSSWLGSRSTTASHTKEKRYKSSHWSCTVSKGTHLYPKKSVFVPQMYILIHKLYVLVPTWYKLLPCVMVPPQRQLLYRFYESVGFHSSSCKLCNYSSIHCNISTFTWNNDLSTSLRCRIWTF